MAESNERTDRAQPARVLVVANRTAATPALVDAVRRRASEGPCRFTLLVPTVAHGLHRAADPEDQTPGEAENTLELAIPVLEEAAGSEVEGQLGVEEPLAAVEDAVNTGEFDEIILSTLPARVSRWLHLDLPRKVAGLGLPVTTVTAKSRGQAGQARSCAASTARMRLEGFEPPRACAHGVLNAARLPFRHIRSATSL